MADKNWIDTIVVIIVVGFGLFILYKPLKEPIDRFGGFIKKIFLGITGKVNSVKEGAENTVLEYG